MASTPLHRNREFRLLWSGQAISALGSQITLVAYPLLVLAVTGSPAKAGVVGFARQLPIAVLALPAGALADRIDRKRLMVTCDAVRAVALASIPIAIVAGSVPYALIVLVAVIDGAGFVFTYVTERGAMRQLVAPEQLGEDHDQQVEPGEDRVAAGEHEHAHPKERPVPDPSEALAGAPRRRLDSGLLELRSDQQLAHHRRDIRE